VVNANDIIMKYKQKHSNGQRFLALLIFASVTMYACSSTGLTRKQREAMEHYVDHTADAIHLSTKKVKQLLSDYKSQHGTWPSDEKDRRVIFNKISDVLREHNISGKKLLEVDKSEVIVEYSLAESAYRQFPQLLESWVIIFSTGQNKDLDIVSIYPHWCDSKEMSAKSLYSASQVESLRTKFQQLLQEKLTTYSLTLNEHFGESRGSDVE